MNFRIVREDVLNHFREKERFYTSKANEYKEFAKENKIQLKEKFGDNPNIDEIYKDFYKCDLWRNLHDDYSSLITENENIADKWAWLIVHLDDTDPVIMSSEEIAKFELVKIYP